MKALDEAARIEAFGPVVTVGDAVVAYEAERGATGRDARGKLQHLAALGSKPMASLTVADLAQWRTGLLDRMGETSARRVVNDAKACLNSAIKRHNGRLPRSLRDIVRDGLAVPRGVRVDNGREQQILPVADIRRLINAALQVDREQDWGGDLARMILTLAATGARFSQIARLHVADLQVAERRLLVPSSLKGAGRKVSHTAVQLGDDAIEALKPATVGRMGHKALLLRPHWRRAPGREFTMVKYTRAPWTAASALTRPWKAVVERAGLPPETVPYSLRHSSIVRSLRAGLPVQLTAKLHDTSSTMIERFYARYIADALHELSRNALVSLMPAVVPFDDRRGGADGRGA
ncbi:MAG TPA: tyrosine-type recombinase/integrase [Roseiarcus sp.]|nr:tyrosine-type recombinase/integrase [Roseiarcus sp.]